MAIDFYGPHLKVKRAKQHISQLEAIFGAYIAAHKEIIAGQADSDAGKTRSFGHRFPEITPAVIGDAVHNLRASLDHAYCILVEANSQSVNSTTMFPFIKEAKGLRARIEGGQKNPNPVPCNAVIDAIIKEIQPYEGGRMGLYGLHLLDRIDKHHMLIPATVETRMEGRAITVTYPNGGKSSWIGGTFLTNLGPKSPHAIFGVGPGLKVEFDGDINSAFEICFAKGQPFENEGIMGKLRELKGVTLEALDIIQKAAA